MANSVVPDQTAPPLGAVWSGSTLFTQTCLSENLGKLQYVPECLNLHGEYKTGCIEVKQNQGISRQYYVKTLRPGRWHSTIYAYQLVYLISFFFLCKNNYIIWFLQ